MGTQRQYGRQQKDGFSIMNATIHSHFKKSCPLATNSASFRVNLSHKTMLDPLAHHLRGELFLEILEQLTEQDPRVFSFHRFGREFGEQSLLHLHRQDPLSRFVAFPTIDSVFKLNAFAWSVRLYLSSTTTLTSSWFLKTFCRHSWSCFFMAISFRLWYSRRSSFLIATYFGILSIRPSPFQYSDMSN